MRRTMLTAVAVVLLACLGACTDDRSDAASDEALVVLPTVTPEPTPLDPFAWSDVDYEDYLAAADELGLRPEVLLPLAGFSSALNALCHTSAEDLAKMRTAQMDHTKETESYSNAKYLGDEVALRLGLACPQRMTDWNAAGSDRDDSGDSDADDGVSAVTDAELAEAVAEEAEASSAPAPADDNNTDRTDGEAAGEGSSTSVSSRP
ncbi:hypothetical protein [Sporichthya sp.]|uniref:hypothetical protein n=1 Tax=Sporichthya sp. TaxID=65475 RepID=UPI00179BD328|nr:hypothetical protein [Sporichthya sp.]MBA3744135.1 hypothetical protein [Sporichthya sp.]